MWMEEKIEACDHTIGVVSEEYLRNKTYSYSERLAAYWQSVKRDGFFIPIVVREVDKFPILIADLKRLNLFDKPEKHAEHELVRFLTPPAAPTLRPTYPGEADETA